MTHDELVMMAANWLRRHQRCAIVTTSRKMMSCEQPDAIGFQCTGRTVLVECKVSRSDFLRDASKPWRLEPHQGMGFLRYYLASPSIVDECDLPERWGLLRPGRRACQVAKTAVCGFGERNMQMELVQLVHYARYRDMSPKSVASKRSVLNSGRVPGEGGE